MTVRLEELLAAFAREPTADSPLEDVLAWTGARQQVEKLAPEMARLLIEWAGDDPERLARLDRLGAKDETA